LIGPDVLVAVELIITLAEHGVDFQVVPEDNIHGVILVLMMVKHVQPKMFKNI
jgi:hypothetical protein